MAGRRLFSFVSNGQNGNLRTVCSYREVFPSHSSILSDILGGKKNSGWYIGLPNGVLTKFSVSSKVKSWPSKVALGGGDPKNQRASDWSLQTGGVKDG